MGEEGDSEEEVWSEGCAGAISIHGCGSLNLAPVLACFSYPLKRVQSETTCAARDSYTKLVNELRSPRKAPQVLLGGREG